LPREVLVVLGGAVFVVVLAVVVALRPTNRRLERLRKHPANRLAPHGELMREVEIPAAGDRAAYVTRSWGSDEDPGELAARFARELAALGFEPTDEDLRPGDVVPPDRLLVHVRAGDVRYALVLQPLPARVGNYLVTHGCRHVVRAILEG
jgi:hypothetical protein